MRKTWIGPAIAITTILVGGLFLGGKTMPVLFNSFSEVQNVFLSNLVYILSMATFLVVFAIWQLKKK